MRGPRSSRSWARTARCWRTERAGRTHVPFAGRAGRGNELSAEPGMESRRAPECGSQFRRAARRVQRMHSAADRVLVRARTERRAEIGLRVRAGPRGRSAERGIAARVTNALRDFRLAGIDLRPTVRRGYRDLQQQLARLGTQIRGKCAGFRRRLHPPRDRGAELAGLPREHRGARPRRCARGGPAGWLFKLDQPTYLSRHDQRRGRASCAATSTAPGSRAPRRRARRAGLDNDPLIEEILQLRHELARLLDFGNFAELALATRMAKNVAQVQKFLAELAGRCRPAADREFADLEAFAGRRLDAWDVAFYREKLQASRFQVSQEELRPYFPLPKVLAGLFALTERLYGIQRARARGCRGVARRACVTTICATPDGRIVAGFYLDPYSRSEKRGGAWMDECVIAKSMPTGTALPVAQLVCNFTAPVGAQPALLTHSEVTTLFHEFGHGLHHMLTRVAYPSIAGINGVAWDAVELPSQFMENFVWRAEVLPLISAHRDSGAALPAQLLRAPARHAFLQCGAGHAAPARARQFDLRAARRLRTCRAGRVAATLARCAPARRGRSGARRSTASAQLLAHLLRRLCGRLLQLQMGRGAGRRRVRGLRARPAYSIRPRPQRFLDSILERGGSLDAMDAFVLFRGREPDVRPAAAPDRYRGVNARASPPGTSTRCACGCRSCSSGSAQIRST